MFLFLLLLLVVKGSSPTQNVTTTTTTTEVDRLGRALVLVPGFSSTALRPITTSMRPGGTVLIRRNGDGHCCKPVVEGICADGLPGNPDCGTRKCNIFGCGCGRCREGWYVTIYEHAFFRGDAVGIIGGFGCRNLRKYCYAETRPFSRVVQERCMEVSGWASSINPHDNCVMVYEKENCEGFSLRIDMKEACRHKLYNCKLFPGGPDWNDKVNAIGPCIKPATQ